MNDILIIVEGENDKKFILSLLHHLNVNIDGHCIKVAGDKDSAKTEFKTQLKSTNKYSTVAIIIDADENPSGTWQSLHQVLSNSNRYDVVHLQTLQSNGVVVNPIDNTDIKIGVWIMPNNKDNGMLEDFVINLVPDEDKLLGKAKNVVVDIDNNRKEYDSVFKKIHISKAILYTWLAWHDAPEETMAQAMKKNMFDELKLQSQQCQEFVRWIKKILS